MLDFSDIIVAAFEIDVFDRYGLTGAFVERSVYDAEGAACECCVRNEA